MSNYSQTVVWITGASSGIGEALVYAYAKLGAKIILSARREEELWRVKNNCTTNKENIQILTLDLERLDSLAALVEKAIGFYGHVDVLINNGGISQRAEVTETTNEVHRKIMEVNYFGTTTLTQALLPHMISNKKGKIVVVSSIAGKFGFYLRSAYSASKFALVGFFESLRLEQLKNNIDVLIVYPGKVKTNISINAMSATGEKFNSLDKAIDKGISSEECAQKIIKAIHQNKRELYVGGKELLVIYIQRFFPKFFFHFIKRVQPQ